MPSTAGATIGIPPVRAVDEADLSVRQLVNWVNIRTKVSVDSYVSEYSPKLFAGEGSDTISTV